MSDSSAAGVEFLGFIAHISCPANGAIDMSRIATWLGITCEEMEGRQMSSGIESWAKFADGILSVRAWGSVKGGSGTTLLLAADDIKVFRSQEHFDSEDCKASHEALSARVHLPVAEVTKACGWFADSALTSKVAETVAEQRELMAMVAVFLLFYGSLPYRWWSSMLAAGAMQKRLDVRQRRKMAPSAGVLPLEASAPEIES
jgi:Family of unknown function (DUF6216)